MNIRESPCRAGGVNSYLLLDVSLSSQISVLRSQSLFKFRQRKGTKISSKDHTQYKSKCAGINDMNIFC